MHRKLKNRLRRAIDGRELLLHYQPKFHLATGELRGVEALLRWHTASGAWIPPATFVPLLEQTDLIHEVGEWLFECATTDAAWWRERGLSIGRIAINVSPLQLCGPEFLRRVRAKCGNWNKCGLGIDIEFTESALMPEPAGLVREMEALAARKVRFALDDFGMGYSSLDLLVRLPVHYLKIDRSFVSRMVAHGKAATLVEAIIRMGHEIGLETIAEGIETPEQLWMLQDLGCDIGQGFLFSAALGRQALLERLGARSTIDFPRRPGQAGARTCVPVLYPMRRMVAVPAG